MRTHLAGDDFENTAFLEGMIECADLDLVSVTPYRLDGSEILNWKPKSKPELNERYM